MSDTKFSYLQLAQVSGSQPELDQEVSLQTLIDDSDALAEEAREVLPYSFDECTYAKGYLRQAIWACIDCGEKGVCYGCSISCHAEHRLVELWTKRNFRCDCPTTSTSSKCTITPGDQQPQEPNEENQYTHNFKGEFCRCGRDYDPETETEAMIQCIACEDWLHETCLNLRSGDTQPEGDDEDDEAKVLIPSDSYDGLICSACVEGNQFLKSKAGTGGCMIIEKKADGEYEVVGRIEEPKSQEVESGIKRGREDGSDEGGKRPKMNSTSDTADIGSADHPVETAAATTPAPTDSGGAEARPDTSSTPSACKRDIFLAHGIREKLHAELDAKMKASLPFDLVDREIYEPPKDEDEDETLDQVTSRVMSGLPRVQAIEAVHGYQIMKDKLLGMLRNHEATGETVKKEDIENFFSQLKQGRAS